MDEAIKSDEAANQFFTELSDCVNSSEFRSSPTVRAICLSNAKRLTQRVPALEPVYQQLYEGVDPDIARLAQ